LNELRNISFGHILKRKLIVCRKEVIQCSPT